VRTLDRDIRRRELRIIEPRRPGLGERAREFIAYRRLVLYFGRRYLEKRYARTWLGWLWIPLRPVLDVAARVFLFGSLLGVPSGDRPYLIFFIAGIGAWQLFDRTAFWATRSLELNRGLLKRFYLPRTTALVGATIPSFVDYLLYFGIMIVAVLYYRVAHGLFYVFPSSALFVSLLGLVLLVLLGLSIGLWTSVLAAQARDVRFTFNYVMGLWFFLTPVIYPISAIPDRYRGIVAYNPVTAPVEMVKYGLLGTAPVSPQAVFSTLVTIIGLTVAGSIYFSRAEAAALEKL